MIPAFNKYSSIGNICEATLKALSNYPSYVEEWIVTEKIHGANFSLTTDGQNVWPGRRQDYMSHDGDYSYFFNCKSTIDQYTSVVKDLHTNYTKTLNNKKVILTVYAEYFGGLYPNTIQTRKPVQKGVWYTPKHEICAFDIYVHDQDTTTLKDGSKKDDPRNDVTDGSKNKSSNQSRYLNYDESIARFEEAKIPYCKIDFRGSLNECIEYSKATYDTNTNVPKYYGLPDIKDNIREGNVLRPATEANFANGDRIILKHKNFKFLEKAKAKNIKLPNSLKVSSELKEKIEDAYQYINEARYANVVSKIGIVDMKSASKLIDDLYKDAMKDWLSNLDVNNLEDYVLQQDIKLFTKIIKQRCAQVTLQQLRK